MDDPKGPSLPFLDSVIWLVSILHKGSFLVEPQERKGGTLGLPGPYPKKGKRPLQDRKHGEFLKRDAWLFINNLNEMLVLLVKLPRTRNQQ